MSAGISQTHEPVMPAMNDAAAPWLCRSCGAYCEPGSGPCACCKEPPGAPLDRYGPLRGVTPQEAAAVMVRIQRLRHESVAEFKQTAIAAAAARRDAVKAKARAHLEATGTVEDRKATAALESADAFFEADCADAVRDACEKSMWVLKDDWDTCRSIGANERAEKNAIEGFGS